MTCNNSSNFLGLASTRAWDTLATKQKSVTSIHFGQTNFQIGQTLKSIATQSLILPPRTGHLADWQPVTEQRAGAIDFNHVLCSSKWARPLLFGFTQTENFEQDSGDRAYRPSSIHNGSHYTSLPLYTWQDERFSELESGASSFLPFTFAKYLGELLPLSYVHQLRNKKSVPYALELEANEIVRALQHFQIDLFKLLQKAHKSSNPRRSLQNFISHQVSVNGAMKRFEWNAFGENLLRQIVDLLHVPLQALTNPVEFMQTTLAKLSTSRITETPLISHHFTSILTALKNPQWKSDSIYVHLHWGARSMAGFPPIKSGYFMEKSTQKSLNEILLSLREDNPELPALLFGLLPSAIFLLCPPARDNNDCQIIEDLIQILLNESDETRWSQMIHNYWLEHRPKTSPYFRHRFCSQPRADVHDIAPTSHFTEPKGFHELTFKQACLITAIISELETLNAN